ncbi:MAG: hypothetical protein SOW48_02670 [Peptoniphilaceae bacterium]|nr:hypothetical protein [Peptoniphilaceae bacterium]MDY6146780.1 hypothetical protein [Peptoniphilaceae bacterium]
MIALYFEKPRICPQKSNPSFWLGILVAEIFFSLEETRFCPKEAEKTPSTKTLKKR